MDGQVIDTSTGNSSGRLLDVRKQITFKDVFAFFVLLGRLIGFVVFPSETSAALAAIDVSHGVCACRHGAIVRLALNNIDNAVKEISPAVLAVERSGYHGVNGCQMGLAGRAAIYALPSEIAAIAHAHLDIDETLARRYC